MLDGATCPKDLTDICHNSTINSCTSKCACSFNFNRATLIPTTTPSSSSSVDPNAKFKAYSWIICVVIMGTVAFISNFGMNLQKLSLMKQAKIDPDSPGAKREIKKWQIVWLVGMSGIVISAGGDTVALIFGSQSLVAPLSSLTLVANAIIANLMHGEVMTKRDYYATILIMAGCVLSVAFASHKDTTYCPEIIWNQFNQLSVILYFSIIVVVVLGLMLFSRWAERVATDLGETSQLYRKWGKFHRVSYAAVSGITGAQSVMLMKIVVELMANWSNGSSQSGISLFIMWQTYPMIIMLATCVALQVYWLNLGLAKFDALSNVPVFQCLWMLFGVISGGIFFREFSTFDTRQSFMFPLGVLFCLFGVFVLSSRPSELDEKDNAMNDASNDSDSDSESTNDKLASPLISSDDSSSSRGYSDMGSNGSILGYDAQDYPNRIELPEYDAVFFDGPMGLGLYPEIVKITHPQYERVQGMVKVWRVRDLPRIPSDGVGSNVSDVSGSSSSSSSSNGNSNSSSSRIESLASKTHNDLQPGPAERQEIKIDMMLVGINGESILRQRNTWRETLLRLTNTARPMVLTFRVVPNGAGLLPEKDDNDSDVYDSTTSSIYNSSDSTGIPPSTPNAIRGSRKQHITTPNGFTDMIHAGQISLSESRKRTSDSRGNLRYGPKSTDGRLRYKKLHGSTRRGRTRSRRRTADYIPRDVLDSHSKLKNRPMMSGTLTMFHQPESVSFR
jgi:uncharacterized membrane protein